MKDKEAELQEIRKNIRHLKFRESMLLGKNYYSEYCRTIFDVRTGRAIVRLREKSISFSSSEGVEDCIRKIDEAFRTSALSQIFRKSNDRKIEGFS